MKNKTIQYLTTGLIFVIILCICVFSFLSVYMKRKSEATVINVGNIYMLGMSERITMHFKTTIQLRLSQVENMVEIVNPEAFSKKEELHRELSYNAVARGFDYLGLYSQSGDFEMLYGEKVQVTDPEPFLQSLLSGEDKIAVGTDESGDSVVLLGIAANYGMTDGGESVALVAGLPVSYIKDILSLDDDSALSTSYIIRRDGSFVIRSDDIKGNYFDHFRAFFGEGNGEEADNQIQAMIRAMDAKESYSVVVESGDERRHVCCAHLPDSEWILVTALPYGVLDQMINSLGSQWTTLGLGGCVIILLALFIVFGGYYHLTRKQIADLDSARQEAIKANAAKSEFLSNMSHDIRTPMNAIVGMTAIAITNIDNPQQVKNCLKKISLSSKHLLGLINDVLDMSKIESGKMTLNMDQVSLREVIDNIVNIVQPQVKAKKQQFDVFIHDIEVEDVYCDSIRLNQVMLNLLSNAIKFTPEGGKVEVALYQENSPLGDDYVRNHLQVKDTGIGMSPEFIKRIFDSFVREDSRRVQKTEGTGLGMAITKYIIDAMGGSIQVESEQDKGTTFYVTLDMEKALVTEEEMILPSWNMLVVDDDKQLCESTVASLKSIGVNAQWALDGETAIEMVGKRHSLHEDYQIILLDWKLPGIDGIQTAREIRRHMGEEVPILLISAYDWGEIRDEAEAAGVTDFIAKPLFKSTLYYGLKKYAGISDGPENQNGKEADLTGRRILLAEDNELNWEIAQELLTELGLELEHAENGQICVEMFQSSPIGYYDGVLMDLRMPVMTGYQATEAIRAMDREDAGLPIIAMTADAFSEDVQKCLDCGMDAHVSKPIDIDEIARLLEKFIWRG
ncbi:MAG: response regulator [Lachnospiraceae bacterium]|nr:response regulator [Lachnospiraceae bacterium]